MHFSIAIALAFLLFQQSAWAMEVEVAPVRDMLPDGNVAEGRQDIRKAWLSAPTTRYTHGVLGDNIEAGAIAVELQNGERLTFTLPTESVFEDRYPRLRDIDSDGRDEIIVVKSSNSQGAALVILGVRDNQLKILAETKPIGKPFRWLNPIDMGDFDGDGKNELAYVETPHIGGTLRVVKWQDDQLVEVHSAFGFSNHVIGTVDLQLSTVLDANGDGIDDLIIPNTLRTVLHIITFKGGEYTELFSIDLGEPMTRLKTDYAFMRALIIDLASGNTAGIRFK
ncbi:MAG: VCBS repeat-containing protein [Magnetovibrio sp.]|nr:VCBS repeat-containing protein [Magnetovibrio sp.]